MMRRLRKTGATQLPPRRSPALATLWGAPIGPLGGPIDLGGAEFRLPVLAGVFGYATRRAVALNLAISLVTVVSAPLIRGGTLSLVPLFGLLSVVAPTSFKHHLPIPSSHSPQGTLSHTSSQNPTNPTRARVSSISKVFVVVGF
jgi:hypothetical protein